VSRDIAFVSEGGHATYAHGFRNFTETVCQVVATSDADTLYIASAGYHAEIRCLTTRQG
jgi:hypothetical protein